MADAFCLRRDANVAVALCFCHDATQSVIRGQIFRLNCQSRHTLVKLRHSFPRAHLWRTGPMHVTRFFKFTGTAALAVILLAAGTASAHHSFAMFDTTKTVTVEGTVKEVSYANPHIWVTMVVMDAQNQAQTWGMEGGNLGGLYR